MLPYPINVISITDLNATTKGGSMRMTFTEEDLDRYSAPLSESEDQRCKNAIGMIRDALQIVGYSEGNQQIERAIPDSPSYSLKMFSSPGGRSVYLFVQGSYANNTNVKAESDVDIAVVLESTFRPRYRSGGQTMANYGFSASLDNVVTFKNDVEKALKDHFGTGVERKNKSIRVHGSSYRVDADSVPCMRHRDYTQDFDNNETNFVGGILIHADDGEEVVNYPEQHILKGREKNVNTGSLYKKMVRIIKKMRYLMQDSHIAAADQASSFGLESLLWNVPNPWYSEYAQYQKVSAFSGLIDYLIAHQDSFSSYKEANGIKSLCPDVGAIAEVEQFLAQLRAFYTYT